MDSLQVGSRRRRRGQRPDSGSSSAWLQAHQPGSTYLLAVQGSNQAGQYILAGASVLPMGGFSGRVPFPTTGQLATLVANGQLRYVMLGEHGDGRPGGEGQRRYDHMGEEHVHRRHRQHTECLRFVRLRRGNDHASSRR